MNKKKKWIIYVLLTIVVVSIIMAFSDSQIRVTEYEIDADFSSPVRIVQLTDLHNRVFGNKNSLLVGTVLDQNPDIIIMTGDMINEDEDDISVVLSLITELSESVPVYYSIGNHEKVYKEYRNTDLKSELEDAGAIVLDYEYIDTIINDNNIRIGGYYGFYWTPHMTTDNTDQFAIMNEFSSSFEQTDSFKLLLCHIPTPWLDWNRIDHFAIDLVLCGHYHGGQVRLPFIGGLYAPYSGWFPKYTKGLFVGEKARCILSTGLGSESFVPRINNPPEIVVIDLK